MNRKPFVLALLAVLSAMPVMAQTTTPIPSKTPAPVMQTYVVAFKGASTPAQIFTMEVKATNLGGVQAELNRLMITADKLVMVIKK